MNDVFENIPGYSYGAPEVPASPVSPREFDDLKISVGFTEQDQRYLRSLVKSSQPRPGKSSHIGQWHHRRHSQPCQALSHARR